MAIKPSKMINPLFSIIIPSYNYEGSIAKAIKSVLEQQGDDFDLLVDEIMATIKNDIKPFDIPRLN